MAPTSSRGGRHTAHRTDEASVMPAEPQCLQEPVPSIDLEVAATALGAKHLLIVCEERQSPGEHSPALQPLVPGEQMRSHRHSPGTTRCQPRGDDARDTRARCLCRAGWPWLPPGHGEEANLISQDAALAFDVHPLSSPWQHRSHGATQQAGRTGMEGSGPREGGPCLPHGLGRAPQHSAAHPSPHGQVLSPDSAWCPGATWSGTWGPWVLPLSQ